MLEISPGDCSLPGLEGEAPSGPVFLGLLLSSQCRLPGESECTMASSTDTLPLLIW